MNAKKKTGKKTAAVLDMMGDHAAGVNVDVSDKGLALVSSLAQLQYGAMLTLARAEDEAKEAKAQLRKIAEEDLPEAMRECGVSEFTTIDGLQIKLKEEVTVGIPAPKRDEAYEWLIEHDFGGLLKSDMALHFDREQLEEAGELADELRAKGYDIELKQSIHYQTLKAFVKERMAEVDAEVEFPLDLFGARPYQIATVKPRK